MGYCSGVGRIFAIGSALFVVVASLVTVFTLSANGSTEAMDRDGLPDLDTGKLVIDTDAGVDDAVALFLALGFEAQQRNSSVRIVAITCVFGNTNVDNVVLNVLKVLKTAKRLGGIPVYRGASRSLLVTPSIEDFYGKDGLGDFVYPDPPNPSDYTTQEHAAIALVRLVTQYQNQITLLCLGPLTNVALAIRLDPLFISKVKQIIILGGSTEGVGNIRPGVEFNFYVDPEANFIVFDAVNASEGNVKPIVLMPWESVVKRNVISMAYISMELPEGHKIMAAVTNVKSEWRRDVLGRVSSPAVQFLNLAEREHFNNEEWHSADALATAVALDPSLVSQTSQCLHAVPEVQGTNARGSLFVDYGRALVNANPNVVIVESMDLPRYKKMLLGFLT